MRIATSTWAFPGIVLGVVIGIGSWLDDSAPPQLERRRAYRVDIPPPLELELEPSSSIVQHEPPSQPFYASLFVAGATWTLPCTMGGLMGDAKPAVLHYDGTAWSPLQFPIEAQTTDVAVRADLVLFASGAQVVALVRDPGW